jgi:hypothetical protein
LPRVLLLHDSFGPFLFPYLSERCSELLCLWDYSLPEDAVELLRPDAVIQIYTERNLVQAPVPMHTAVRLLERGACAGLDEWIHVDGVAAERTELVPWGSTTLAPVAVGEAPGIAIETKVEADMFATPPVVLPPGSRPVLHIDITLARATALSIWYQTREVRHFVRRNACQVVLPAGRSDLCFEMCVDAVAGPLLIRPSLQPGRCILHGLAISASKP